MAKHTRSQEDSGLRPAPGGRLAPHPAARPTALRPGALGEAFMVSVHALGQALPRGLMRAAELDPLTTTVPLPPLQWSDGANSLLVMLDDVRAQPGDGFVDVHMPVRCDGMKGACVVCTFVTARDAADGFVWACEAQPRGPAAIVGPWGEALTALAWQALVETLLLLTAGAGRDVHDRALIPASVCASPGGLSVLPRARHVFARSGAAQ